MASSEDGFEATPNATAVRLRGLLLGLHVFGTAGVLAELLLMEHFEDALQYIPLMLLGADLLVVGWWLVARDRLSLRSFQAMMAAFAVSGLAGLWLHYQANVEFKLELSPGLAGWQLFTEAIMGATPALAPGTMLYLAAIGLAFTFRHPVLGSRS